VGACEVMHALYGLTGYLLFRKDRRDWDGLELVAMLLGAGNCAGADSGSTGAGNGRAAGADLSAGMELGILGCLRDAADQQRLNRGVVTQVTLHRHCPASSRVSS